MKLIAPLALLMTSAFAYNPEPIDIEDGLTNNIRFHISKQGEQRLQDEYKNMVKAQKELSEEKVYQDVQTAMKGLAKAKPVGPFKEKVKEFATSEEKAELLEKWNDFGAQFREGMHKESDTGDIVMDNEYVDKASDSFDLLEHKVVQLNHSKWGDEARKFYQDIQKTKEFDAVKNAYIQYYIWSRKQKPYLHSVAKLKEALNQEMKVTDMPTTVKGKHFFGEAKDLYDSIYKDAMDDLKLERQMKKEMEEERKKEEEKKKKKEALAAMIDMHQLYQDVVMF